MSDIFSADLDAALVRLAELEAARRGAKRTHRMHETKRLQGMRAEREALTRKERRWGTGSSRDPSPTLGRNIMLSLTFLSGGVLLVAFFLGTWPVRVATTIGVSLFLTSALVVHQTIRAILRSVTSTARKELERRIALEEAALDAKDFLSQEGIPAPTTLEEAEARIAQLTAQTAGEAPKNG